MTAKLFSEMMNLNNRIRPFPFLDYKISSNETAILEMNGIIANTNNPIIRLKQDKLTFLNSSHKIILLLLTTIILQN
jgi:hypothetical protein